MDVHADAEPLQFHLRRRAPAEARVVDVQLAVDPGGQLAVRLTRVVDLDHVFQAIPLVALQDHALVVGRSQHVSPVVAVAIPLHVHPVGVEKHVPRRRIASPAAPGLEGTLEVVVALRPDARRPHGLPPICSGNAGQPAADMVQVALVVVGSELDVAAEVDAVVPVRPEPGGGTGTGLTAVPRRRR